MKYLAICAPAVLAASLLLTAGTRYVHASPVIPVGTFAGNYSEEWEGFNNTNQGPTNLADPTAIMGGAASISDASMTIYQTSGDVVNFGLGNSGTAQTIGAKGMGIDDAPISSTTTITFASPVSRFGAFWAATDGGVVPTTVTVEFFDALDMSLDVVNFQYGHDDGQLDWHGWSAAPFEAFAKITYFGNGVAIDSLQATASAPEPASLMLLAVGLTGIAGYSLIRRRKNHFKSGI